MERDGFLIVSELFVDDDRSGPADAALMSMNVLVETMGRNYTAMEYRNWLPEAGLVDLETVKFTSPGVNGAIIVRKL